MKLLVVSASAKQGGTVNTVCKKLLEGAESVGHDTEIINLHDYHMKHCIGCMQCTKTKQCILKDDFDVLFEKVKEADYIILGSPIYCHNVAGIMKDFLDRSCFAVTPYVEIQQEDKLFDKLKRGIRYLDGFKNNAPFKTKKLITVLACSNPISDFKEADTQIKKFAEEMGIKRIQKVRCADTLFRLNPKSIDKIYKRAFAMGANIK